MFFELFFPYDIFFFTILGLLFGSFANVIIYRMPKGESSTLPRSRCTQCKKNIYWYENIPVVSWLFLKGKCSKCKAPISWRYPIVELLMGALFTLGYVQIGQQWFLLEFLYFSFALVVVSFIDFDHYILPDKFTLTGIIIGLAAAAVNPERAFVDAFVGVLMGGGFLWAIAYLYWVWRKQEGMGGGDIKLLAWIGAVLGWRSIPFVILVSSCVGALVGLAVMTYKKQNTQAAIPFGPYLALAAILYALGGDMVQQGLNWYLQLFSL